MEGGRRGGGSRRLGFISSGRLVCGWLAGGRYTIPTDLRTAVFRDFCRFGGNVYICGEKNGGEGANHYLQAYQSTPTRGKKTIQRYFLNNSKFLLNSKRKFVE